MQGLRARRAGACSAKHTQHARPHPHLRRLPLQASQQLRNRCHAFLLTQLPPEVHPAAEAAAGRGALPGGEGASSAASASDMEVDVGVRQQEAGRWGIAPFFVEQRPLPGGAALGARFNFQAPTTGRNALRVLRALQVRAAVLAALATCRCVSPAWVRPGQPRCRQCPAAPLWLPACPCVAAAQAHPPGGVARCWQDVAHRRHGQGSG